MTKSVGSEASHEHRSGAVKAGTGTPLEHIAAPVSHELVEAARRFDAELLSDVPFVNELCERVRLYRGKMLRPTLLLLTARACGRVTDEHITLAAVVEMVHAATLVHDDVLDESDLRRRHATLNATEGNHAAVLLGDYLISHAFHLCSSLQDQHASRLIGSTTNRVCEGELMQVRRRGELTLTEPDYLEIIQRKTAVLTGACSALGARYAGADSRVVDRWEQFGVDLGMAFQIVDDVLDCVGDEGEMGKSLGRDVQMGEVTLPVIYALSTMECDDRERLQAALTNGSSRDRQNLVEWLERSGGIDYAYSRATEYLERARNHLGEVGPGAARDSLLDVVDFVVSRRR